MNITEKRIPDLKKLTGNVRQTPPIIELVIADIV